MTISAIPTKRKIPLDGTFDPSRPRGRLPRHQVSRSSLAKMCWGQPHKTAKCSLLHRDAVRLMTEQRLQRLSNLGDLAVRFVSLQGVALVANRIRLPLPHSQRNDEKQQPEPPSGKKTKSKYLGLKDVDLVKERQAEKTRIIDATLAMPPDDDDHAQETMHGRLSTCRPCVELATQMHTLLHGASNEEDDPDLLTPFDDTFVGKLEAFLLHLDEGCCKTDTESVTREGLHHGSEGVLLTNEYCIGEAHMQKLQEEIDKLERYHKRMMAELRSWGEALRLNKRRWGRRCPKAKLMKSEGFGSPLREICDPTSIAVSFDSWDDWQPPVQRRRVVLVPQPEAKEDELESHGGSAFQHKNRERWHTQEVCW